jgi:hypothetical protein
MEGVDVSRIIRLAELCILAGWLAGYACIGVAAAQTPAYDLVREKEMAAERAMNACRDRQKEMAAERAMNACRDRSSECELEKAAAGFASAARVSGAAADLDKITNRINRYVVCRRAKRWWQFWKRCRY